jgi:hypothetical protein
MRRMDQYSESVSKDRGRSSSPTGEMLRPSTMVQVAEEEEEEEEEENEGGRIPIQLWEGIGGGAVIASIEGTARACLFQGLVG